MRRKANAKQRTPRIGTIRGERSCEGRRMRSNEHRELEQFEVSVHVKEGECEATNTEETQFLRCSFKT